MGVLFDIGIQLLGAVAPLIASGLGALILRGTALISARTTSEKQKAALGHISEVVITVVQALLQTGVNAAKSANGGTLTGPQAEKYKGEALDTVKKILGKDMLESYSKLLGYDDIVAYISDKIESALYANKQGVVQVATSNATDTVTLPDFYRADAAHPAQKGAGTLVGAPPAAPQPVTR